MVWRSKPGRDARGGRRLPSVPGGAAMAVLATVLLVLVAGTVIWLRAQPTAPGKQVAAFEARECWGPASDAVDLRCGVLIVSESRERPNGRKVRLAVTVLTPAGAAADALETPLLHLAGGPGYGAGMAGFALTGWLDWYAGWAGGGNRALILVDQRGTGQSEPLLECAADTVETAWRGYFGRPIAATAVERAAEFRDFLMECRAPFDAAGIDVAAYNTAESAADLVDLRRSLGIDGWHVWGGSYGTELALELLRVDEAAVRSLILDSVSLYNRPGIVVASSAQTFDRALRQVVRDCLLNEACKAAHPVMLGGFGSAISYLNMRPEKIVLDGGLGWDGMEIVLDGRRAAELLFHGMYVPDAISVLPGVMFSSGLRQFEAFNYFAQVMMAMVVYAPHADVMAASVMCRAAPDEDGLARLKDLEGRYPNYGVLSWTEHLSAICPDWGATPADPAELGPVHSDVPTLILSGRYDPVTPPEWGHIVAEWLPNSTVVEFPHLSHGSISLDPCADAIAARFLAHPEGDPRDGCFAALRPPTFLLGMGVQIPTDE